MKYKIIAIGLIAVSVFTVFFYKNEKDNVLKMKEYESKVESFKVYKIEPTSCEPMFNFFGQVALTEFELQSFTDGQIIFVNNKLRTGAIFNKGDLLFELDDTKIDADICQIKAGIIEVEKEIKKVKIEKKLEEANIKFLKLNKNEADQLLKIKADDLAYYENRLSSLNNQLKVSLKEKECTKIKAPFSCVVTKQNVWISNIVSSGTTIAKLHNRENIIIEFNVDHKILDNISGSKVIINDSIDGNIIGKKYERTESDMTCIFVEANCKQDQFLYPRSFCELKIKGKRLDNVVVLARKLINQDSVWILDQNNTILKKKIKVLAAEDNNYVVDNDFDEFDRVIDPISCDFELINGKKIEN